MKFYIVIPAHNEADFIGETLQSLINQSLRPAKIVVVDDHSTDETAAIVTDLSKQYPWISLVSNTSSEAHLPGGKIINAFYKGYDSLDSGYDVICKFDADVIFPENYLETLAKHYENNPRLGMVAGHCYIEQNGTWVYENITSKKHIRGPIKSYRKDCFNKIGGLKKSIGWDTIDELLALYYQWEFETDASLHVKHLKPTGANYNKSAKHLQGTALYKMRYGFALAFLSALKLAYKKRRISLFWDYMTGYIKAYKQTEPFLITEDQGIFVRTYRWKNIKRKFRLRR
ncbi:glycosyltransferase family 2 protein [Flavobacteriaceae bacterium]|nr:glycosyltransferase family 2 protein [Flavobacteriaceae bacterium]